jgi:hypothetical protein
MVSGVRKPDWLTKQLAAPSAPKSEGWRLAFPVIVVQRPPRRPFRLNERVDRRDLATRSQPCRFVRRPSVERHERTPDSGSPHDAGPPAVGRNRRDFDEIGAPPDRFFEAMNDVGHQSRRGIFFGLSAPFSPVTRRDSSEATDEGEARQHRRPFLRVGRLPSVG